MNVKEASLFKQQEKATKRKLKRKLHSVLLL
jgi:predicted Holliday junction resolvase-like endonuclease